VRGLALAVSCPALGISSLCSIAEAARAEGGLAHRPLLAIADARRDELFAQPFDAELRPLAEPALCAKQDLAGLAGKALIVGDEAARLAVSGVLELGYIVSGMRARYVATAARRLLARGVRPGPATALAPLYGREPDARPAAGRALVQGVS
jgi:tRNA threonylcarbamoyladenosine biosynthesis protein TsaB